jgi:hypothetical protein
VDKVRKEGYDNGAAAGGLAIAYATATSVVESKLVVPGLQKTFAEIQEKFEHIKNLARDAHTNIAPGQSKRLPWKLK